LNYEGIVIASGHVFFQRMRGLTWKTWGYLRCWLVCSMSFLLLAGCATPSPDPATSQNRAAYVCIFGEFAQWPDEAFAGATAPFVIGIYGVDTLGGRLQNIAENQRINGRKVVVRPVHTDAEMRSCQILFIGGVKHLCLPGSTGRFSEADLAGITARLSNAAVLTISENVRHFSESGIMINLSDGVKKTHFEINVAAANRAGLKISAKLQSLAWGIVK
jgi:hypothetical protein